MKSINDYRNYILLGGGVMAERLYKQLETGDRKLAGVTDMLDEEKRSKKVFHDFPIQSPDCFEEQVKSGEAAVVAAIGSVHVDKIIRSYLEKYPWGEENLFVVNPYSSLRFFFIDEELAGEERIPVTDSRYREVKELFLDQASLDTYEALVNALPYDSKEGPYEVVPYGKIKDIYHQEEDYWQSYEFPSTCTEDRATVLDCGAYIGDSVLPLCRKIPQKDITYYAFEPDSDNVAEMKNNEELYRCCSRFEIMECGVGEKNDTLFFKLPADQNKEGGRFFDHGDGEDAGRLEIRSLDKLELDIRGRLYIKMDIEGSELAALKGAKELIRTYKPYLAVCLYHRKNDLVQIPLFIKELLPRDYDFYLRGGYHTILWAIPKEDQKNDQF